MNRSEITDTNKIAWEKTASVHRSLKMASLLENFKKPGFSLLDPAETSFLLDKIQVHGKDVIQLCCNNARELLSIKNLGAKRCVGIDITEGFIEQGKELSRVAKQDLELYSMDVFTISDSLYDSFDLVYITVGAIVWLPDLSEFFNIVSKLLRPGGFFLLHDLHPILGMFEPTSPNPIVPFNSYFKSDPFIEEEWTDYYDESVKFNLKSYNFQHTLEEILMSCLSNNIQIREFREYEHDISIVFEMYKKYKFPMSYILLGQKS